MRGEYDFSKGVRGKFLRAGVTLLIPVYLEPEVQALVAECAAKAGTGVNDLVNQAPVGRGLPSQPGSPPPRGHEDPPSRKTRAAPSAEAAEPAVR
jgi:hypothetical protein